MKQYILRKYCVQCEGLFYANDMLFYTDNGYGMFMCQNCAERENMTNIKITAEIDGKQVPLETVSIETFEAIKALEKQEEIPVARLADYYNEAQRLLIAPKTTIALEAGKVYSFNLESGAKVAEWPISEDKHAISRTYKNVRPL